MSVVWHHPSRLRHIRGKSNLLAVRCSTPKSKGQHLLALDRAARAHSISIRRVIFDVGLQPKLAASPAGAQAMQRLAFNKQQAWVRHDEHYHVDFAVPCR